MDESQNAEPADAKAIANKICAPISRAVLVVTLIYTFLFCWWMVFDVKLMWELYTNMNIPGGLPALTKLFLRISFILPWLGALAGIVGLVKEFLVRDRRVTLIINTVHIVCLTLFHQLFHAALSLPLIKITYSFGT